MYKRNIIIVIALITLLGFFLEITRVNYKLASIVNINAQNIDINIKGRRIDKNIFNDIQSEKYLIIYDSTEEEFVDIKDNIERTLDYIKKDYITLPLNKVNKINNDFCTIVVITSETTKINDLDGLFKYAFEGGNILFAYRTDLSTIYNKIGVKDFSNFIETTGIKLYSNLFIKGAGEEFNGSSFINSSYSVSLSDKLDLYGTSTDNVRLMWKKQYGSGNIIYFNGTMLSEKNTRGLIVGLLGKLDNSFIYPIVNAKVMFIDDFPFPIADGFYGKITKEYDLNIRKFYRDIWWKSMIKIANKYNVIYTTSIIGSFDDKVSIITELSSDKFKEDYRNFARDILSMKGEIGIHGYNHQPLKVDKYINKKLGYKNWESKDTIAMGLNKLNKLNKSILPKYEFSIYVPPSNIISDYGREVLIDVNKEIKVISSLYTENVRDEYSQEFEISSDGIIEFPRISSSYNYSEYKKWEIINGINLLGIYSHFIQPYNVYNEVSWEKTLKEFDGFNYQIYNDYKWLRPMTASKAANELVKYLNVDVKYKKTDKYIKIYCDNFNGPLYFILKSHSNIKETDNCTASKIEDGIYLIEVTDTVSKIIYER